ncbi:hypothetical protein M422DRAFT_260303 [Sphaerobolus stellatus SS14]|uniref:Uncharacterized protein n=1 Tax=Sphaerobolus stellatus (strain SS14) TaxID=990650 RepID=A0A0C9U2R7_SPHS4|nr:hypothetical protein M422DRAFT_260303 [Sphaerobolus stellatus SS14]
MPPVTRRQAQQHQPERSPSWECETGSLPVDDSQPPSPTSSPNSDIGSDTGVGSDEEDFEDPSNNNKHVRNARSPNWLPWQDRFLLREVSAHRPILASRHDAAAERNSLAARLKENSRKQAHRQNETHSLQKTGANEEIDEHVQTMTNVVGLIGGNQASKKEFLNTKKEQHKLEMEMCDAMLKGHVPREILTNITQLGQGTVHEKQGQWKQKLNACDDLDKENDPSHVSKWPHRQNVLEKVLMCREESDQRLLEAAHEQDERRHGELRDGLTRIEIRIINWTSNKIFLKARRGAYEILGDLQVM